MKKIKINLVVLFIIANIISCSKEETEGSKIQTELKGHVSDRIRGINISGYEVFLYRGWRLWEAGEYEQVGKAVTDLNGNYSIKFEYNIKSYESYDFIAPSLSYNQDNLYYTEVDYTPNFEIKAGLINILNINAWKPVQLELNLEVLNNDNRSLVVYNEIVSHMFYQFNRESIWYPNITDTYTLNSRPDSDITIVFQYHSGTYPNLVESKKTFNYRTTLEDVQVLNFTIDCSTF